MKAIPKLSFTQSRTAKLLVVLVLLTTGLIIYGQTLVYPFISFDDPGYVVQNSSVNEGLTWAGWRWAWTSLERSNWHPLTWLSLMLDAQFYGKNAGGYHLTNLLLHETNGVLVFWWLLMATRAFWPSALTAFFFVAHPLHVESVAWVTERKDVLSTLFFCFTLLAYTRYVLTGKQCFRWLAVGLFAFGLTAKPMLVTLPPLLLLLDYWPLCRMQKFEWKSLLGEKVPFITLAAASCVVTVLAQRSEALVPLEQLPLAYRMASAALGYGSYLSKTLFPVNLGVYYPYWYSQSMVRPMVWASLLVAVSAAAFLARRAWPFALVGWGWFLGTLVPVIGVVQVGGQAVADRYTYLPHIGLFIAVFWTGAAAWERRGIRVRVGLSTAVLVAAAAAVGLSHRQAGYWRNSAALFEQTVSVVRPTARLYHLLGNAEVEANQPVKAIEAYFHAWRMGATINEIIGPLGTLLLNAKRWQEAAEVLAPAAERPTSTANMLNDLAVALANSGRSDEALIVYQRCTERFPKFAMAQFGWAELLQARGWVADAATHDEIGLTLRADWLPALLRLSWNYAYSPDPKTREIGLALAQHAVTITDAREFGSLNALALTAAANGCWDQAVDAASKALAMAESGGMPEETVNGCRKRLEFYRRHQMLP